MLLLLDEELIPVQHSFNITLALDKGKYGDLIAMLNTKMNRLIEEEVGEDIGQMLPSGDGASWTFSTSIDDFRPWLAS